MSKSLDKHLKIRPVILSGGAGTRLWPISRQHFPKQFAPLVGKENLFTTTIRRVSDRSRYAAPLVIGNSEHKFFILDALDALKISDAAVLLEPMGRNTAAAAIVAALAESEPNTLHLVMPSDHLVADEAAFHAAVAEAAVAAKAGQIVLFGISPDRAETGYGYIIPGKAAGKNTIRPIAQFTEKPDHAKAVLLMEKGALWNSGIFLYDPRVLSDEAKQLDKKHFAACKTALDKAKPDGRVYLLDKKAYEGMEKHAFDTLIMEQTKRGAVLPCSMGWNDIGSWQALWQLAEKDGHGNAVTGSVIAKDVADSYIRSEGPIVAALGMEDCLIVATKDVVLVAPTARSQDIKGLLSLVEKSHHGETAMTHPCVSRPWGTFETIALGKNYRVKHIMVYPGRSLSLQMHHHRAEHWVVVVGTAKIECDGIEKLLFPNESLFIPKGATHRLTNPGKIDLELIEVQSGEYLNEDDIVRFEDIYGRAPAVAEDTAKKAKKA